MKKILSTLSMALLCAAGANAQAVLGYTLTESTGIYSPLTDATVIFDGSVNDISDTFSLPRTVISPDGLKTSMGSTQGYAIGFDLSLGDATYTDFLVSTAGYVYLGNGEISFNPMMGGNFLTYGSDFTTVGFYNTLGFEYTADSRISYQTLGEGDEQHLTVQFTDYAVKTTSTGATYPVDIQLNLYADGKVTMVLNGFSSLASDEDKPAVLWAGIRQEGNYVSASGDSGSLTVNHNDRDGANFGANTPDGTTLTWNIPTECAAPAAQPTDLVLTSTSDQINGSFTPVEGADYYLVLYTEGDAVPGVPEDGTVYAKGEVLGEATVAGYGADTNFVIYNLTGGKYNCYVYAVGAFGLNGPKYNTVDPLEASIGTKPAAPGEAVIDATTADSITIDVASNEADDDVVVVYNSYCDHNNMGDHGLFGTLAPDAKAGDVLPVPEDFQPFYEGQGMPENAGVVAYAGKAGKVTISDLKVSTGYFIGIYTRNAQGEYTTQPLYTGASTYLEYPYDGDSYNFPRFSLPLGWTGSENGQTTYSFRDEEFIDRASGGPSRGTQLIQQRANVSRGDAVNGKEAWMVSPTVMVNDRHVTATFSYSITEGISRFQTQAYNSWAEEDVLQILVSADGGETWTEANSYTAALHPEQEDVNGYVDITADLNDYRGQTVMVKLYWKTFMAPAFGGNMYVDRFTLTQAEFPEVPVVSVSDITYNSAKVNWASQQTDYELAYRLSDSEAEWTTVSVEGELSYTLTDLEALTAYEVKVRGLIASTEEGEQEVEYTEWSDISVFTTTDYPEVEAPENLVANVDSYAANGTVTLSWDAIEEAESYEVAYRMSGATSWTYVNTEVAEVTLADLEKTQTYVWKVRAFCTHDRTTSYSAQSSFTTTEPTGVEALEADGVTVAAGRGYITVSGAEGQAVAVYTTAGAYVAGVAEASAEERFDLTAGIYVVKTGNKTHKRAVK